ncbi:MAG: radical SAM protein [Thermodesulfobacteriota bacterium]
MTSAQGYEFIIQWHLTDKCNLKCRHCYQEGGLTQEMTLPEIAGVISEIVGMLEYWQEAYGIDFSPSFNITGGEPFLRPDIFTILERLAATGFDLYILSNGTLISPETARTLAALRVQGVQVSLEGPAEIHDRIRGKGSFAASLTGIRQLLAAGVKVSLNATLSQYNAAYFHDLIEIATTLGVPELGFSRLVPSGRGRDLLTQMLSPAEVKQLYEAILSLEVDSLALMSGDPLVAQMSLPVAEANGAVPTGGCAAGVSGLTLLPDGTILPCRRLPIPIGNVRQDSLREVWATSPVLERLRDKSQYHGKCGDCSRWALCRGCRAIAYAYAQAQGTADFLGEDPQCFIE